MISLVSRFPTFSSSAMASTTHMSIVTCPSLGRSSKSAVARAVTPHDVISQQCAPALLAVGAFPACRTGRPPDRHAMVLTRSPWRQRKTMRAESQAVTTFFEERVRIRPEPRSKYLPRGRSSPLACEGYFRHGHDRGSQPRHQPDITDSYRKAGGIGHPPRYLIRTGALAA